MSRERILLATTNRGKVREIKKFLADLPIEIVGLRDLGIRTTFRERGKTFRENARGKSLFYSRKSKILTLAEDSGLEVHQLDGAPGIYSARFSGRGANDEKNLQKVLRLLEGVPAGKRKATFVSCLALAKDGRTIREIRGEVTGRIARRKKGRFGFGYDPIFYYPPLRKNFAELRPAEKNRVSHRGRALRKLRSYLVRYLAASPAHN